MSKVLTLTLNPALDISTTVDAVRPDIKLRCRPPRIDPGGGGVNVSRAMAKLGAPSCCFVALGGTTGATLLDRLGDEAIPVVRFDIPGETRQSFAVREESSNHQYRFVLPGPDWTPGLFKSCLDALGAHVDRGDVVVVSGSLPPGLPPSAALDLCAFAEARGASVLVDTSGPALRALLDDAAGGPAGRILIMNKDESERLAGGDIDVAAAAALVRRLLDAGAAATAITTLGALGAVAASGPDTWAAAPPEAPIISKVGAGDSFAAGYVIAISQRRSPADALRYAMAAATSAITTPATELCTREGTDTYLQDVELTRI